MYKNKKCKLGLLALAISLGLTGCDLDGKDGDQGLIGLKGELGGVGNNGDDGKSLPRALNVEVVGRFATGIYGKSAAEIVQFHKNSNSAGTWCCCAVIQFHLYWPLLNTIERPWQAA